MFRVTTLDLDNLPRTADGKVDYSRISSAKGNQPYRIRSAFRGNLCNGVPQCLYLQYTFRAENSNTTRHAAEFWMIEPEMAFADLNDNMEIAEKC